MSFFRGMYEKDHFCSGRHARILGAQFLASPALAFDACLGAKVTACLDAVRPYVSAIDYQLAQSNIGKFLAGDIAGMRKPKGSLSVAYHSQHSEQYEPPQLLLLDYGPSLVTSAGF